ncbi:trypsin-like [Zerene cesonia]|uniref:trypsin-like n=1 Tax=Zerene cesonia TaxID=33412 RepID=UPI0018E53963|nr:trypsin-like [Zerene cesonia]
MNYLGGGCVILIIVSQINAENYDDESNENSNASASVDSESNEVFNSSIWAKPKRVIRKETISVKKDNVINNQPKVMNSQIIRNSSYPFSVSIQKKQSHYASGALVDSKWILTAAGDFYNVRESIKLFRARLGSVNCKKSGILVALKAVEVHPLYVYKEPQYDIALLRLAQPVTFNEHMKPIAISSAVENVSGKFYTTYWPRLIVNGQVLPASAKERLKHNSMRVSTQKLIPWKKCYRMLSASNKSLEHSTSCLEPIVTHHSPCIPDVGAPIISDDTLWGVTSGWISDTCLVHPSPTLFTRVSQENTRFWLDSILLET